MGPLVAAAAILKKVPLKVYAILGVILLLGGAVLYVNHLQNKVETLSTELVSANAAIESTGELMAQMQVDIVKIQKSYSDLSKLREDNAQALEKSTKALSNVVSKVKQNPKDTIIDLNNLMKERRRCAELASGAAVIQGEQNSVCPQFIH